MDDHERDLTGIGMRLYEVGEDWDDERNSELVKAVANTLIRISEEMPYMSYALKNLIQEEMERQD